MVRETHRKRARACTRERMRMTEINVSVWTGGVHLIVLALVDSEIYLHDLNDKYDGQDDGCRGDTGQIRG